MFIPPLRRRGGILFYPCPSEVPSQFFSVKDFSGTTNARPLIFGMQLQVGVPYREI